MSFLHFIDKFVLPGNRNSTPCCRDVFRIGKCSFPSRNQDSTEKSNVSSIMYETYQGKLNVIIPTKISVLN